MKKTLTEHINKYLVKHMNEEEKLNELAVLIDNFFTNIPEENSDIHENFYAEIELFTNEIDEEMLTEIINSLRNKNGEISGAKWTLEEAKTVIKQYDIKTKIEACGKTLDCLKFWFALNYVFAVHYSINRTINGYIDLSVDEYCNKNICFDTTIRKIFEKI
jgi:hypothetical protein